MRSVELPFDLKKFFNDLKSATWSIEMDCRVTCDSSGSVLGKEVATAK